MRTEAYQLQALDQIDVGVVSSVKWFHTARCEYYRAPCAGACANPQRILVRVDGDGSEYVFDAFIELEVFRPGQVLDEPEFQPHLLAADAPVVEVDSGW